MSHLKPSFLCKGSVLDGISSASELVTEADMETEQYFDALRLFMVSSDDSGEY